MMPDPAAYADALRQSFEELKAAASPNGAPVKPARSPRPARGAKAHA
jgi:hypothetical protein